MAAARISGTHLADIYPAAKGFDYLDKPVVFGKSIPLSTSAPDFAAGSVLAHHAHSSDYEDPVGAHVARVLQSPALPLNMNADTRKRMEAINPDLVGGLFGFQQGLKDFYSPGTSIGPIRAVLYANGIFSKTYPDHWAGKAERARDVNAAVTGLLPYAAATYFGGLPVAFAMGGLGGIVDELLLKFPTSATRTQP